MKTTIKITTLALAAVMMSFKPATVTVSQKTVFTEAFTSPTISWKSDDVSIGEIPQSKPVDIIFEFTNTGKDPVIISEVKASCGCTAANYSKLPVLPGQTTKITATFNAASKGVFKKTITVTTNAEEAPKVLSFSGTVI
ncbi:MAG: hypothetical protein K0S32_3041 [Bacteroidetes bacterium]|jgi:hypothetical protein|nr:hypothetical protein [Bacteroidota bacterium]